jgi:hypothetical protein
MMLIVHNMQLTRLYQACILAALAAASYVCSMFLIDGQPCHADIPLDPVPIVIHNSCIRSGDNIHITWSSQFPGDFNRDGVVDIRDVTPIAMYFGHQASENGYMEYLSGGRDSVGVSSISLIAWTYGSRVMRYEIRLAPIYDGPYRVVKELDWYNYDLPLDGVPHYTTDVAIENTDMYYWVAAVLEPDLSFRSRS